MIEPTAEIQRAYAEAWFRTIGMDEEDVQRMVAIELHDPMPWRLAALKAVLALVERDYDVQRRTSHGWPARVWPLNRGALHPHYCVSCSDGHAMGPGCINCRQTGYDQTPWPNCQECQP